ncbi:MAG TPA: tannase/feruloyl esterase family alpha/beta hydrolase [Vicinamibacterales bacterium]|nr:tannase/feruloyl esterase family alpha/beta hydrolase [Vicinamibacterales bacterium]
MQRRSVLTAALFLLCSPASMAAAAGACSSLTQLSIPQTTVTGAESMEPGRFVPPDVRGSAGGRRDAFAGVPAFCRVTLTSKPSADSDIRIEVWLPESGWNGRLQAVGDGGLAGFIPYPLMAPALAAGYVAAGTDTGHVGGTAEFMPQHPEKLVDFAYRSTHQLAVAAKAVATAFYDRAPTWTYYNACSGGGRHALTSAQRYPADFNGIVAGASTWDQARLDAGRIGINLTVNRTADSQIPAGKYAMIHDAVLQACDRIDGVRDGVIEDPRECRFDYASLRCPGADGPSCLTAAQVESAKVLTSPFTDPGSGTVLLSSHLRPGAELLWATLGGPQPLTNSLDRVRRFHLKDPSWEFRLDAIGSDLDRAVRGDGGLLASNNVDLKPFFERGGKLLMWHGWSDPQVPAEHSILYYESVLRTVGPDAGRSLALFMLPGVSHCGGGPGPDTFDKMGPITAWVEQEKKPDRIVASHVTSGQVDRTRPLCPFGQIARYNGSGSTDDAVNFSCVAATPPADVH